MGSGNCSFWAPGVFDLDDDGIAIVLDPAGAARGQDRARGAGLPDPGDHRDPRRRQAGLIDGIVRRPDGSSATHRAMPIGITEEHEATARRASAGSSTRASRPPSPRGRARRRRPRRCPPFWDALAEPGWIGLHVDDGAGTLVEQAVVVEELGRACAPGPYVPTAIVAAVLAADGGPAAKDAAADGVARAS